MTLHVTATQAELTAGVLLVIVLLGGLFFAAGARIPELHAADKARAVLAAVTGTGVILGALALIGIGARHARPMTIIFGVIFALIGLPIIGITVGLPEPLVPLAGLLNAFVGIVNGILDFLALIGGAFT